MAWRQWQGDLVVYNPVSGATHVLDVASGEVLLALMQGVAARDDLADRVAALLEVERDDKLRAGTGKILADLDRLGLAEPVAP